MPEQRSGEYGIQIHLSGLDFLASVYYYGRNRTFGEQIANAQIFKREADALSWGSDQIAVHQGQVKRLKEVTNEVQEADCC